MKKEHLILAILGGMVILLNLLHWKYMDTHVVINGVVFEMVGMGKGQDSSSGKDIYFPIYNKR